MKASCFRKPGAYCPDSKEKQNKNITHMGTRTHTQKKTSNLYHPYDYYDIKT